MWRGGDSSFLAADPAAFFSRRRDVYDRFIRIARYPEGLRAFFSASSLLRPQMRILDAGCGTGAVTLALRDALAQRRQPVSAFNAFDLTEEMLERFRDTLRRREIADVELRQADVLQLAALPATWSDYDLIATAAMLEYVPRCRFVEALVALRDRLSADGKLVLFMSRRNPFTRLVIGYWWKSNLYTERELAEAFKNAGFSSCIIRRFPAKAAHLSIWGQIIEANR